MSQDRLLLRIMDSLSLIDHILEYLHEDIPTLRACSLVSHSFRPSTLPHIYHQIVLVHLSEMDMFREYHPGRLYQCSKFFGLLCANADIARFVRMLSICSDLEGVHLLGQDPSFPSIMSKLSNLACIKMVNRNTLSDWMLFPEASRSALLLVFQSPALTTLHLDGMDNIPDRDTRLILSRGPSSSLRHLSLKWVSISLCPPVGRPQETLPVLESLALAGDDGNIILKNIVLPNIFFDTRYIRKLSIQVSEIYPRLPDIEKALDELRESLEHFTLDVSAIDYHGASPLRLGDCRRLKFLYMIIASFDRQLFTPVPCANLHRFIIELVSEDLVAQPWREAIDAYMYEAPALQQVEVKLHDSGHEQCESYWCDGDYIKYIPNNHRDLVKQVEEDLPLLRSKGILTVEVVPSGFFFC
ncbi:hypothetical protein IW261DRAFT_1511367 [Armillaria novae-zelandiae]|uniref:Uncharacterized protein n=1 Tax=Armillaria novae-zelandiae TaxID=153914 RepID=A0AA39U687_9AGAR|nr:hypothetical protein IW261DRAFT_1511367 [Armillaria novae-zelandiae]